MTRAFSIAFVCMIALAAAPEIQWREAVPGHRFDFPRDHFAHPDFRTEWWYYTGNVRDTDGKRFGFELVFFRQGARRGESSNVSAWRVDDLYLAHAALTDVSGKRFVYTERLNRAGPGVAGADFEQRRVWNGNWSVQWRDNDQRLIALTPDFKLTLQLTPLKPPIINGENGVSQKAEGLGKASYYVSFPRLGVSGEISAGGRRRLVTGTAWMDHEWFTHQLQSGQTGWDWFSIQLENNTELMLFELRKSDGSIDSHSSGTYIDAAGKGHHLNANAFRLTPLDKWKRYPIHWKIEAPSLDIQLDCRAALAGQELRGSKGATTYWEGAVDYTGSSKGVGYLEMTGYDKPVDF